MEPAVVPILGPTILRQRGREVKAEAYAVRLALGVVPVFAFLWALALLDTYKLVSFRRILRAVTWGSIAGCLCYFLNTAVFRAAGPWSSWHARLGAPILEEVAKAAYVIWLVRTAQVGFMVDAAICGVAAGAGFALVENVGDLNLLGSTTLAVWTLRGFGTAMMHGGTTAIVGVLVANRTAALVPGLLLAISIHAAWNMALLTPLEASITVLLGLPLLFMFIFVRSEKSLRKWMGEKFDQDMEVLNMISTGRFLETNAGRYLRRLRDVLPPHIVGDMLCLLQLTLRLSVRAKGDMILREAGFEPEADPSLDAEFREMKFLEKSIGLAGRRALDPLLPAGSRDLWEMRRLSDRD